MRLAESLAALRGLALAGLPELTEATQAVLCFGRSEPLDLIQRKLIVGERMGRVPPDAPMTPLQRDLYRLQRELVLHAGAGSRTWPWICAKRWITTAAACCIGSICSESPGASA